MKFIRYKSFTLFELLIVIVIVSVVASLGYARFRVVMSNQQCISARLKVVALAGKMKICFLKKGKDCPAHGFIDELAEEFNSTDAAYYYTAEASCGQVCSYEIKATKIDDHKHFLFFSCEANQAIKLDEIYCVNCPKVCAQSLQKIKDKEDKEEKDKEEKDKEPKA